MSDIMDQETETDESLDDELIELHSEAMEEFTRVQTALYEERQLCREDRLFVDVAGQQYNGLLFQNFDNKPKLEFDKVSQAVQHPINEYRNNPITVKYVSKDGEENTKLSEVCDGLFRAAMQRGSGEQAINNAYEEAIKGGMGALRITEEYEDEEHPDNEQQVIKIEAIYEADTSVYFDLDAKSQDKSDARHCFVLYSMTRGAFEEEFNEDLSITHPIGGDIQPTSMPKASPVEGTFNWYTPDVVYIAEWYKVEEEKETLQIWENIGGVEEKHWSQEFKEDPELKATLDAQGSRLVRTRRIPRRKIHKYLIDGSRILEDCGFISGKYIPIIPVYGMRSFIDNIERVQGKVRKAKDPQRLFNMQISKMAEIAAFSSIEKPIFAPAQISGFEDLWAEDNIKDNPYLLAHILFGLDGITPIASGPIAYTHAPALTPAMTALVPFIDQSMKEILGTNQDMQSIPANTSAEAINSVFNKMDVRDFIFLSNLAIAIRWLGTVALSKMKELYTEKGRKMKIIGTQGEISSVKLMAPGMTKDGVQTTENDLTRASFEVVASVGPSSTTKRQAFVDSLIKLLPAVAQDPVMTKMLSFLILLNTEAEGMSDVQEYVRKELVAMGAFKPTNEEAKAMAEQQANAKPSAADQAQLKFAEAQQAKADLDRTDIIKTLEETKRINAETQKILAEAMQIQQKIHEGARTSVISELGSMSVPAESIPTPPEQPSTPMPMGQS